MKRKFMRWRKVYCMALALIVVGIAGFMGIQKFAPEERSLTIVDESAIVSSVITAADAVSEIASETAAKAPETTFDATETTLKTADTTANAAEELKIDGKSAILIDGHSGKVLFEQNAKKHLPPASVTKVMTILLIMEGCKSGKISLDDNVIISERAAGMGGSQMYMEPGEKHTVRELLKGVIMVSANDGCVALAEHLCGSVESFVEEMNNKARKMGLKNSNFINTNGLPVANHYSCAYDIGMISKELAKYDETHEWFTAWQEDIQVGLPGKKSKFTLTNTNKLIRSYNGAIGLKTGFTQDAGYCLSGAAERDSTMLIGVVLGCKTSDIRFAEMTKLLDYGFANYETVKIAAAGEKMRSVKVDKGEKERIYAVAEESIGLTVVKGNKGKVRTKVKIAEDVRPPIKKGEKIGMIMILENDKQVAEYEMVSDRDVKRADFMTIYIRMMKKLI